MPNPPIYSVLISKAEKNGSVAYFFQCNDPETDPPEGAILYGKMVLYCGTDFVKMRDPHDAIVFCNYLNETSKNA